MEWLASIKTILTIAGLLVGGGGLAGGRFLGWRAALPLIVEGATSLKYSLKNVKKQNNYAIEIRRAYKNGEFLGDLINQSATLAEEMQSKTTIETTLDQLQTRIGKR